MKLFQKVTKKFGTLLPRTKKARAGVFVVIFALFGTTLLVFSQAASPFIALEAESATLTAPAIIGTDTNASGGSYVQFKPAGTTPTGNVGPANCQLTQADEACWAATTGVKNDFTSDPNDRWTQSQIVNDTLVNGHRPSEQLGAWLNGCQNITPAMAAGATAANPYVYKNKRIRGVLGIQASYVKVENVYVEQTDSGWCAQGAPGNGAGCCSAIMTGNDDNQTAATKIRNVQIVDTEVESGPYSLGSGIIGPGVNVQRVNAHGGFIIMGYNNRSYIQDTYLHDVTREDECVYQLTQDGQSCVSHTGVTRVRGTPDGYLHKDTLWEQGVPDLAIVHSYMKHSSWTNPIGGSSGGCLCNEGSYGPPYNVYLSDSLLHGGSGVGIIVCETQNMRKIVWNNVRLGGKSPFSCSPPSFSDYIAGPWTPVWDTTSPGPGPPGIPAIDKSHCTGIMNISGTPIPC